MTTVAKQQRQVINVELHVATFNIAGGQHPDLEALQRLFSQEHLAVIGVQEVDRFTDRNPFDMPAVIGGTQYTNSFAEAMPLMGGSYGIATFADRPLAACDATHFASRGEEPRVFQRGVYHVAGHDIAVYNTHFAFEKPALRIDEAAQLLDALGADPLKEQIVFGDFNMDQRHEEWQVLAEQLNMANGQDGRWLDTYMWRDATMQQFAIDNIFTSRNLTLSNVRTVTPILSDHLMLAADVGFY
ncbi:endonuclease/exonuclease/phosphatase family protein [Lacticaseibacillus yichunensis]|uniref:Endonuclease/exonuclease/phosphatase family protein n=1 Tax=Lacticaseibacillus yichunensis TaxID=2486015 RepID=A0ABW4CRW1_9LACO|nr:endonuclease/exonuclease/phosphatase family protein [Lacticaseibacillus yichunensis]